MAQAHTHTHSAYSAVSQHCEDDDTMVVTLDNGSSSPFSSSPASAFSHPQSPMAYLSLAETAFTPLSLDSGDDFDDGDDTMGTIDSCLSDKNGDVVAVAAATREGRGGALKERSKSPPAVVRAAQLAVAADTATADKGTPTRQWTRATAAAAPQRRPEQMLKPLTEMRSDPSDTSSNDTNSPSLLSISSPTTTNNNNTSSLTSPAGTSSAQSPLPVGSPGDRRSKNATDPQPRAENLSQLLSVLVPDEGEGRSIQRASISGIIPIRPQFTTTNKQPLNASAESSDHNHHHHHQQTAAPPIVRTTSSRGRLPLRHPVPDLNVRSGAYTGNIAQLEATAERFSMTSSIEDAIREAHLELKRSDSRRSSILAASVHNLSFESVTDPTASPAPLFTKPSSIIGINNEARLGGYSPSGYVMSPTHSLVGSRFRSESGSGSAVGDNLSVADDSFSSASRHGPGKASVRSVLSDKAPLPEIVGTELPMTLTLEALDEADRLIAEGEDPEDDDTIRASAHQHVDFDVDFDAGMADLDLTPDADVWAHQPMLDNRVGTPLNYFAHDPSQQPPAHPPHYTAYQPEHPNNYERPTTSGSGGTYDQARMAFGDFDGVHCDPNYSDFPESHHPEQRRPQRMSRPLGPPPPRPKSYFDPGTGQQMLYYPARVPAMLNLPPKLSRNPKAAERNMRRSKVLSAMKLDSHGSQERESRIWLPDPLEGEMGSPLMETEEESTVRKSQESPQPSIQVTEAQRSPSILDQPPNADVLPETEAPQQFRRPQRLTDVDKRKSRMSLAGLPPQLRASAFFDLPATSPQLEVKNGSAMDTLESILDAAASAPVSAFTDHAFAGKLGSEVYGAERKRKKRTAAEKAHLRASTATALEVKKRSSFLSLVGHMRKNSEPLDAADRRTVISVDGTIEERQRLSGEALSPTFSEGGHALAPDDDEQESSSEDEENGEEHYDGPPTTLLAELQLRKQQQKMRTRPVNQAFPNGMHSTLLELDAVAEVERKARKGKRVNLAWEDPVMNPDTVEDSDDEDVPLGMLYAARAAGGNDISAVAAELNRPLGLMEKKHLEDNEPLSRRRDRLQGRDPGVSVYLNPGGANAMQRQSMMTLTPTIAALNGAGAISPGTAKQPEAAEEEVEGETLGARMRRLKEKELPRARPVSGAFSMELLSQFGDPEEEAREKEKAAQAKEHAKPEEEETLGQRRRRLQAEKDASSRMAGSGLAVNGAALHALTGSNRLSARPMSMAHVLGAHPFDRARGVVDPREVERLRREEEAARVAREKDAKMAMLRAQMPTSMSTTSLGGGVARPGGYMGGRFNDGIGGGAGMPLTMHQDGRGLGQWASRPNGAGLRAVSSFGGFGAVPQGNMGVNMNMNGMGMGMGMPAGFPGYNNMNAFPQQGHTDMVERWRQDVQ